MLNCFRSFAFFLVDLSHVISVDIIQASHLRFASQRGREAGRMSGRAAAPPMLADSSPTLVAGRLDRWASPRPSAPTPSLIQLIQARQQQQLSVGVRISLLPRACETERPSIK